MSTLGYLYRSRSRRSYTERRGESILAENILAENILGQIYFMSTGDTSDLNPVLDDVTVLMLCSPLILCSALTCLNNQTLSLSLCLSLCHSVSLSLSHLISSLRTAGPFSTTWRRSGRGTRATLSGRDPSQGI